jgi:hypothetical protein
MITNKTIEVGGLNWLIREAKSEEHALNAIASARMSGSVGCKHERDETYVGGGVSVEADVVRVNSDGTELKPYATAY